MDFSFPLFIFFCFATTAASQRPKSDCSYAYGIKPGKKSSSFEWKSSMNKLEEQTCLFSVFGSENCQVGLQCSSVIWKDENEKTQETPELLISDGFAEKRWRLGKHSISVKPSSSSLRDLFLSVKIPSGNFTVEVKCLSRCDGKKWMDPLDAKVVTKTPNDCHCGIQPGCHDGRCSSNSTSEVAKVNQYPWLAAVVPSNSRKVLCAASVINNKYVLTVGHCLPDHYHDKFEVLLHANHLQNRRYKFSEEETSVSSDEIEGFRRFEVIEVIKHPLYKSMDKSKTDHYRYDAALLRLDREIMFDEHDSDSAIPICLLNSNDYDDEVKYTGKNFTLAGWLWDPVEGEDYWKVIDASLHNAELPYMTYEDCKNFFSEKKMYPGIICTDNSKEKNKNSCRGDEGGPLFYKESNQQIVQVGHLLWDGISLKYRTCFEGEPSLYVKTSELVQWIRFHTSDAKSCKASI